MRVAGVQRCCSRVNAGWVEGDVEVGGGVVGVKGWGWGVDTTSDHRGARCGRRRGELAWGDFPSRWVARYVRRAPDVARAGHLVILLIAAARSPGVVPSMDNENPVVAVGASLPLRSMKWTLLLLLLIVAATELGIMLVLPAIVPADNAVLMAWADVGLLGVLSIGCIWLLVLRPLRRVKEATAENHRRSEDVLARQISLTAIPTEIVTAAANIPCMTQMLQICSEVILNRLDAVLTRIWLFDDATEELELKASAGLYTCCDDQYGRVALGSASKIAVIARTQRALLTNDLHGDAAPENKEWVQEAGLTSFAGYPIVLDEHLIGVLAICSREPLSPVVVNHMATVADLMASWITRRRAVEQLRESRANLEEAVTARTADLERVTAAEH